MEILLIRLSLGHIKILDHHLIEGSVNVLTNPAMPNMVKIGKTTKDVELRLADLYSTGVPLFLPEILFGLVLSIIKRRIKKRIMDE